MPFFGQEVEKGEDGARELTAKDGKKVDPFLLNIHFRYLRICLAKMVLLLVDNKDLFFCHFAKGRDDYSKSIKSKNCSQMFGEILKPKAFQVTT